jgi:5-methylcytosine-specific restriction endonuclease McrA
MELIARKRALEQGLQRYFTGCVCPRGHVSERYVSTMSCVACGAAIAKDLKVARAAVREIRPLSARQTAAKRGDLQYVPATPCHRCGTSRRLVSNGVCLCCAATKMRARYQEDAELRDNQAAYRKREGEAVKAHVRKRRAAIHGANGSHSADNIADLFDEQEGRCPYCDVFLRSWHVDHKTPLTRGGANCRDNLQLTCATCNTRKHTKTDAEFRDVLSRASAVAKR